MLLCAAVLCAGLLLLVGIAGWMIEPEIADDIVKDIVHANTDDVNEWHLVAHNTLSEFTDIASIITVSLSLAVVGLVGFTILAELRFSRGNAPLSSTEKSK
jgi:hypothetical protein